VVPPVVTPVVPPVVAPVVAQNQVAQPVVAQNQVAAASGFAEFDDRCNRRARRAPPPAPTPEEGRVSTLFDKMPTLSVRARFCLLSALS
jgi:hypothetical protein